ncbi:hypothetical protein ACIQAA_24265 [Neobacillus sp. NPDC093182]|uniref:hypothetical protein n=1 Tax=Neobacillus sp. NPDC093182 TaxID=3364297 RepID=UPI00382DA5F3
MITDRILRLYGYTEGELIPINDGFHNTVYTNGNHIFRVSPSSRRKQAVGRNNRQAPFCRGLRESKVNIH